MAAVAAVEISPQVLCCQLNQHVHCTCHKSRVEQSAETASPLVVVIHFSIGTFPLVRVLSTDYIQV